MFKINERKFSLLVVLFLFVGVKIPVGALQGLPPQAQCLRPVNVDIDLLFVREIGEEFMVNLVVYYGDGGYWGQSWASLITTGARKMTLSFPIDLPCDEGMYARVEFARVGAREHQSLPLTISLDGTPEPVTMLNSDFR